MAAYAYPIKINKEPQVIRYEKKVDLDYESVLTLADLREYGVTEDSSFEILENEITHKCTLIIYFKRLETDAEVKIRVEKEEAYMKEYNKRQNQKMMEEGGSLDDEASDNKHMLQSKVKEIKHHADELEDIANSAERVEAWVVAKAERASTDLSDITHYLGGEEIITFAKGGSIASILTKGKNAVLKGYDKAKDLAKKGSDKAKEKLHDEKEKIAVSVLKQTQKDASSTERQVLKKAEKIVKDKFEEGGETYSKGGAISGSLYSEIENPVEYLRAMGAKLDSDLNYCTEKNGIDYYIGTKGHKAIVVAFVEDEENYMLDKEDAREMASNARTKGIESVELYTNYGIELNSRNERPETIGFDKIYKVVREFADGGQIWNAENIYKMAEEMTDAEYEKKFNELNKKQKNSVETLIRLGDSPKLALATIYLKKDEEHDSDTWNLYRYSDGGETYAKGGQINAVGKRFIFSENGFVVKEVRDFYTDKLLNEVEVNGIKYLRNKAYKTYNAQDNEGSLGKSNSLLTKDDLVSLSKMEQGGEIFSDKSIDARAENLLKKLKEEGKLKRYFDTRGNGIKYFETIVPNKEEKGFYKRYESASRGTLGILQNEFLTEDDVLNRFKKTLKPITENEMKWGGRTTFQEKVDAVADSLTGRSVKPKYQKTYGKKYDRKEAVEAARKIIGKQKAKYESKK